MGASSHPPIRRRVLVAGPTTGALLPLNPLGRLTQYVLAVCCVSVRHHPGSKPLESES
ncbi:uncharacterized protein METZ01_LOCUS301425 [marine metagenome]|uniref:Uncharacterized protein n=1 Tax=marine metagenome TaxID=408172 RepID=A0A382MMN6_9ZZZZ